MKRILTKLFCFLLFSGGLIAADKNVNEASEPKVQSQESINLIEGNSLKAWKVPSSLWSTSDNVIIGDTGKEKLQKPQWLYTKQKFGDFLFTSEFKLTGTTAPNSGIYYRVKPFIFDRIKKKGAFEAASGYEYDLSYNKFLGSLGDWYARPSLRIFPDNKITDQLIKKNGWNRATIRAKSNRLEYWLNGVKIMDFIDHDPKASRSGVIGLQIHDGALMKIEFRKMHILPLEKSLHSK